MGVAESLISSTSLLSRSAARQLQLSDFIGFFKRANSDVFCKASCLCFLGRHTIQTETGQEIALLSLGISPDEATPAYVQIYAQIRRLILERRLSGGLRLPSSRALAEQLGVSRTTTSAAYDELAAEGYVHSRRGAGVFVAADLPEDYLANRQQRPSAAEANELLPPATTASIRPLDRSFDVGRPDAEAFPAQLWSQLLARSARREMSTLLRARAAHGLDPLRQAIAQHLRDFRGLNCDWRQVLITSGVREGLELLCESLLSPGATVVMEDPGYPAARRLFAARGHSVLSVPVDRQGLTVDPDGQAYRSAEIALVTPSRQYPLGMPLSAPRRLALLNWADRKGAWIIEDDYDSEYRYSGRPLDALMSLDRSGRVIYLGSFSKVMFRGLRLGFLVVPDGLIANCSEVQASLGPQASLVAQPAMAAFIAEGHLATHLRRTRRLYAERLANLRRIIDDELGESLQPLPQDGGMHVASYLGEDLAKRCRDTSLAAFAADAGLALTPLSPHYVSSQPRQGLLLGFTGAQETEMRQAGEQLRGIIASLG